MGYKQITLLTFKFYCLAFLGAKAWVEYIVYTTKLPLHSRFIDFLGKLDHFHYEHLKEKAIINSYITFFIFLIFI